jgi:hypothetical protein
MTTGTETDPGDFPQKQHVSEWSRQCANFRTWERNELLLKNPSPDTVERHRQLLGILIKTTELMIAGGKNHKVYDAALLERLKVIRERLMDSWSQFCEPMPLAESDKILAEVFPNES